MSAWASLMDLVLDNFCFTWDICNATKKCIHCKPRARAKLLQFWFCEYQVEEKQH
ncbi:hypothetical protein DAI22_12g128401 [Oryza sativa Japonica Group]|nr:hypothetical protein DAI22_12g128401 [Oryza sativa Japonica Group]